MMALKAIYIHQNTLLHRYYCQLQKLLFFFSVATQILGLQGGLPEVL